MKVKKIKSIAITAIMALSSLTALPMSASAITDPNYDGSVNIADVVLIEAYIDGTIDFETAELWLLDFNEDYSVDIRDSIACQRYLTGLDY